MLEPTVPRLLAGRRYQELGWPVFVLGNGKTPIRNCPRCDSRRPDTYERHSPSGCTCLTCHGFYAASLDGDKLEAQIAARPDGMLAIRTGGLSRLLVIDAESSAATVGDTDVTGLDVLDSWESWVPGEWSLPKTLRQRTSSGGLHLVYRIQDGVAIGCHNRILPQVDIKADSGYILVADGTDARRWLDDVSTLSMAPPEMLEWITSAVGRGGGGSGHGGGRGQLLKGEDYDRAYREGARDGEREPFFATLSFKLRKAGKTEQEVYDEMFAHWEACAQPPEASSYFHWSYVEYKIERDRNIQPDILPAQQKWALRFGSEVAVGGHRKTGRITVMAPTKSWRSR